MILHMIPQAWLDLLPAAAAILGLASVGLYLGALRPRLGSARSAWRIRRNLEDFEARFGRDGSGSTLWRAFLLLSAAALLMGLLSMALRVRLLSTW